MLYPLALKGFRDFTDGTKYFSSRFLGSEKQKNIFLFVLYMLIAYFFLSFVLFLLKRKKKDYEIRLLGSEKYGQKRFHFLS